MKVTTCSNCNRDFWSKDGDDKLCFTCFRETQKNLPPEPIVQPKIVYEPVERDLSGYVYILKSSNGFYKIGKAKNVHDRVKSWQHEFPLKIRLIHSFACHDYSLVENNLHNKYAKKRLQREWYKLDKTDIEYLLHVEDYELG